MIISFLPKKPPKTVRLLWDYGVKQIGAEKDPFCWVDNTIEYMTQKFEGEDSGTQTNWYVNLWDQKKKKKQTKKPALIAYTIRWNHFSFYIYSLKYCPNLRNAKGLSILKFSI